MFGKSKKNKLQSERKIYTSGYAPAGESDKLLSFSVKEAYKAVRTNIVLSLIKDGCKIITFTSPVPSEGKSTTVSNVAVSLAKAFYKVLLIDCDLLKPRLHRTFKLKNNSGLSNVLSKLSTFEESVQVLENYSGLHILTSGIAVPNPSEMLGSSRMKNLLSDLSEKYDYILIDTPPINILSDGLSLATISDGVVLVVRQEHSTHDEIKQALSSLKFISVKVLGIVYNGASTEKAGSPYGKKSGKYGKYSSYGYAATYGDTDRNRSKSENGDFIRVENKSDSEDSDTAN
jgi:capsular exopolysaccharide synthesis family protein